MLNRTAIAVFGIALAAWPASLRAELRYTVLTLDRSAPRPGWKPPEDRTDTYIVGSRGARFQSTHVDEFLPAGGVMLGLRDGTVIVLDPAKRTYWRYPHVPALPAGSAADGTVGALRRPDVSSSSTHTGEFDVILGIRCERVSWQTTMKFQPLPAGGPPIPVNPTITTSKLLQQASTATQR